jgi:iron(III) transport system ATP-binding protein
MNHQSPSVVAGHEVSIQALEKRYGKAVALRDLDLVIGAGRFVVLLGPSGSGKSTLARCLAGVERVDGGSLHMGGTLVADGRHHLPPDRRNLAMVFQDYALWPHLTVAGNVGYALRRRKLSGTEVDRRVGEVLERVGLARMKDRYPHELSGGEQQRVSLARAVVGRPGLLIFDEPLSNLDADLRERLRVEIATLTRETGATAVYITHDQLEAFALADEIVVLDQGRIIQHGSPEEIYHQPRTPFVARFTGIAGELSGVVTTSAGEQVLVDVGGAYLWGRAADDLRPGESARLMVRPVATSLHASDAVTDAALRGTVVDVAYRGRGYDHVVETAAGRLSAVFGPSRWERGASVAVALDPSGCSAYQAGATSPLEADRQPLSAVSVTA